MIRVSDLEDNGPIWLSPVPSFVTGLNLSGCSDAIFRSQVHESDLTELARFVWAAEGEVDRVFYYLSEGQGNHYFVVTWMAEYERLADGLAAWAGRCGYESVDEMLLQSFLDGRLSAEGFGLVRVRLEAEGYKIHMGLAVLEGEMTAPYRVEGVSKEWDGGLP